MNKVHLRLVLAVILTMVLLALASAAVHTWAWDDRAVQNSSATVVRIEPASTSVEQGATFTVTVSIQGAQALGAFQFNLEFDPGIVQVDDVALGPFLGSMGRSTDTIEPQIARLVSSPVDGRRLAGGQGIDLGFDVLVLHRHRKVNLRQAQGVPVAQFVLDGGCIADGLPRSNVSVGG
jgi:hypothetical protein